MTNPYENVIATDVKIHIWQRKTLFIYVYIYACKYISLFGMYVYIYKYLTTCQ